MSGFDLLRPALAWVLLAVPLVLLCGWRALARSGSELAHWVAARHRRRFLPGSAPGRERLRLVLGAAGLLGLALAALGPVRGYTYRSVSQKGLDLVLCLDTSRSMLAQDLRPSRLERAKREIIGLLDHLKGDRVALVAFSGDARDVAPLTRDRGTLVGLLAHVSPEDNQAGGTDLAAAIAHALSLFDGRTGAHEAIVLLTDGEDLEGQAAAQAEEALRRGIRIFVVGIGTEAGGKIPVVGPDGSQAFLRDADGTEVVTKLGRESLAALARRTSGEFLSAEEAPTALEDLYRARIARIEGRELEGGERRVPFDRFQWPLALGLAGLLCELALRARAPKALGGGQRLAAALLPLWAAFPQQEFSFARSLENAVRHQRSGDLAAAELAAQSILEHADELELGEPERAKAHFALGVIATTRALASPEEGESRRAVARESFAAARALAGPGELRLDATYDLGALELFHAEELRATIPEVSGQPAAPALPAPGHGGPPGAPASEPAPDPLPEARAAYRAARGWFIERLRLAWEDEDTRANLELIQRRLHELDEIEKQREQQEEPKQDSQDPGDKQDPQSQDKQDKQDQQDKQDGDQENKENEKDEGDPEPGQEQKEDQEKQPPESSAEPEPREPGEEEQPPQDPQAAPEDEPKAAEPPPDGPQAAQPKEPAERLLTREEVMQLLDKLGDLEKQQKALEAALRARRRASAKRDW